MGEMARRGGYHPEHATKALQLAERFACMKHNRSVTPRHGNLMRVTRYLERDFDRQKRTA